MNKLASLRELAEIISDLRSELTLARTDLKEARELLRSLMESEVIKSAPFYSYSEAILSAKEWLAGAGGGK